MVVKSNPEFGIELALVIPYAYYLHTQGKLDTVVTSRGMKPFYYFCDDVREDYQHRTINNEAAGLNRLPNNWIHGIDSVGNPGVLDYKEWISPPYRDHYKNDEFIFDGRPTVFITSKYNLEHGNPPLGFFDIKCLYEMFEYLTGAGYSVIYKRATNKEPEFTIDQNEEGALAQGYQEISADVEGLGVITDRQLPSYMENVWLLDDIETEYSLNETQLKIMSNCEYFITVCGGNSIMSSLFGGTVISYIHKGKELRPNYFSKDSYFRKLSNANFIPVYDVIGSINRNTYHYEVNETGTNDYSGLIKTIKETIR
tara:strand:+ start:2982 stop:3917 length:936 start_codon:yes stop_codon:yes gene_type:complete